MDEEETYASVAGARGEFEDSDVPGAKTAARWTRHDESWAAFEQRAAAAKEKAKEGSEPARAIDTNHVPSSVRTRHGCDGQGGGNSAPVAAIRVSDVPWWGHGRHARKQHRERRTTGTRASRVSSTPDHQKAPR
jgi:hypothetical protein